MIPVSVITGFLGSGKTTLLARLLRDPAMARTAVIINEFGAVGLDHELVETSDESFIQLSNGCLCCNVRSDLVLTLGDLAARRAAGTVPQFERVVVETTGLADPAPILHALMTDRALCEVYALDGVITTVDAVTGLATLDRYPESLRQAAVADRLILTKTDVPEAQTAALCARLAQINPGAPVLEVVGGAVAPAALFDCGFYDADGKHPDVQAWLAHEAHVYRSRPFFASSSGRYRELLRRARPAIARGHAAAAAFGARRKLRCRSAAHERHRQRGRRT